MTRPDTPAALRLDLERHLSAPPDRVFRAWTEPAEVGAWFAPDPAMDTEAEVDLRVGGRYRIRMGEFVVGGRYTEVSRPDRLAFTWRWEAGTDADDAAEMHVTVELEPDGDGTRLRLRHERLPNEAERDSHAQGWEANLVRLTEHLAA